jgi:hypothetical protein
MKAISDRRRAMRIPTPFIALVLGVSVIGASEAAQAKKRAPQPNGFERGGYNDPYYGRQDGRICARWCLQDRNPCDPPQFKVADGRCYEDF